jgi:hypothetical protein
MASHVYTVLTEPVVTEWRSSKKVPKSIEQSFVQAAADHKRSSALKAGAVHPLKVLLAELSTRVVEEYLAINDTVQFLQSVFGPEEEQNAAARDDMADVLWGVSSRYAPADTEEPSDEWTVLCRFVSALEAKAVISAATLKTVLDEKLLQVNTPLTQVPSCCLERLLLVI